MSLTTSAQSWMADLGGRERSALTARRHIGAETSTDVDEIVATVSPDVFFAIPVRTRAGHELRDRTVLTDAAQVRGYYDGRSGSYVVRESQQLTSIATDWYVLNETAATLLGTGDVMGVDATGREWVVRSVVLFPTAPDGIRGEICATWAPMDDVLRGTLVATPGSAVANAALLDRLSLAARDGDWTRAGAELADIHTLAVRLDDADGTPTVHTARDGAAARALLPTLLGGGADLTVLNRLATDWFVFAEYLVPLADGGSRRLAVIQPVEDGRVIGTFGYGRLEMGT